MDEAPGTCVVEDGQARGVLAETKAGRRAILADGTILCLYECDQVTHMCDDRYLRLARFDLAWLTTP